MHGMSNVCVMASAPTQKKSMGKKLVPLVPHLVGEISGVLLKMDDTEILCMLRCPVFLHAKVKEAMLSLQSNQAQDTAPKSTNNTASIIPVLKIKFPLIDVKVLNNGKLKH